MLGAVVYTQRKYWQKVATSNIYDLPASSTLAAEAGRFATLRTLGTQQKNNNNEWELKHLDSDNKV